MTQQQSHAYHLAPRAVADRDNYILAWPTSGKPLALDLAAASILACFEEGASAEEVIDDLVNAIGLEPNAAIRVTSDIVNKGLAAGHLIPEGLNPMPVDRFFYPPVASP